MKLLGNKMSEERSLDMDIKELADAAGKLADEYRYRPTKKGFH
jgi:hypothetical protein